LHVELGKELTSRINLRLEGARLQIRECRHLIDDLISAPLLVLALSSQESIEDCLLDFWIDIPFASQLCFDLFIHTVLCLAVQSLVKRLGLPGLVFFHYAFTLFVYSRFEVVCCRGLFLWLNVLFNC